MFWFGVGPCEGHIERNCLEKIKRILMLFISLRFQEIAGALDSALMVGSVVPSKSSLPELKESGYFVLGQSISLLECLRSCWRDDVLVLSCSDKFLRLTLQLLSRLACYRKWVQNLSMVFFFPFIKNIKCLYN